MQDFQFILALDRNFRKVFRDKYAVVTICSVMELPIQEQIEECTRRKDKGSEHPITWILELYLILLDLMTYVLKPYTSQTC